MPGFDPSGYTGLDGLGYLEQGIATVEAAAYAPAWKVPNAPTLSMNTIFASGHGWTAANNTAGGTSLNDTTDFVLGTQSAKVQTIGDGSGTTFGKLGQPSFSMSGRMFQAWVKLDDVTNYGASGLQMYAGDTSLANFYLLNCLSNTGGSAIKAGEWIPVRFGFNNATTTGSPNRAAITDTRFRMTDNNTGIKVVFHFNGLATLPDPTQFPNGVISLSFDDGYLTQYTAARPKLNQYGFPATAYIIRDQIGTTNHMSLQQLHDLQTNDGWEIASHADTQVAHDARFSNLNADQLDKEFRGIKSWLRLNGFFGFDQFAYPGGTSADWNLTSESIVKQYFRSARLTTNYPRQKWPAVMPYRIGCTGVDSSSVLATIQTEIDRAVTEKDWLQLFFHGVGDSGQISAVNFSTLIDYIATKGIAVKTVGDVMAS